MVTRPCGPKLAGSVKPLILDFCWVAYHDGMRGAQSNCHMNRMNAFL